MLLVGVEADWPRLAEGSFEKLRLAKVYLDLLLLLAEYSICKSIGLSLLKTQAAGRESGLV